MKEKEKNRTILWTSLENIKGNNNTIRNKTQVCSGIIPE